MDKSSIRISIHVGYIQAFAQMGLHHPLYWVLLSGCLELASSFAFTTGFLTRVGALGFALYLVISSLLGGHFRNGFIWANQGGGWEFPIFWAVISVLFALYGAVGLSLDNTLKRHFQLPGWLKLMMGSVS